MEETIKEPIKDDKKEIKNNKVVDKVVPLIITNAQQYVGYLKDKFGPREIMELPKNLSNKGTKTLPTTFRPL